MFGRAPRKLEEITTEALEPCRGEPWLGGEENQNINYYFATRSPALCVQSTPTDQPTFLAAKLHP